MTGWEVVRPLSCIANQGISDRFARQYDGRTGLGRHLRGRFEARSKCFDNTGGGDRAFRASSPTAMVTDCSLAIEEGTKIRRLGIILVFLCVAAQPAASQDDDLLEFNVGVYDMASRRPAPAPSFGLEYRLGWNLIREVKPFGGAFVTTDATFFAYVGLMLEFSLGRVLGNEYLDRVRIAVDGGGGIYSRGNAPKDLGFISEFRLGGEISHPFDNGMRLSIAMRHLSNAWISDENPGAEIVTVNLIVPFRRVIVR